MSTTAEVILSLHEQIDDTGRLILRLETRLYQTKAWPLQQGMRISLRSLQRRKDRLEKEIAALQGPSEFR